MTDSKKDKKSNKLGTAFITFLVMIFSFTLLVSILASFLITKELDISSVTTLIGTKSIDIPVKDSLFLLNISMVTSSIFIVLTLFVKLMSGGKNTGVDIGKVKQLNNAHNRLKEEYINLKEESEYIALRDLYNQEIINNVSDAVIETDENGVILHLNDGLGDITGIDPDTIIGLSLFENLHRNYKKEAKKIFSDMVKGKVEDFFIETKIKSSDGFVMVNLTSKVNREVENSKKRYLFTVQSVDDFYTTNKKLSSLEENYKDVFDNAVSGIYRSSIDGKLLKVNPAMAEIFGYDDPKDMMANIKNIGKHLYVSPEKRVEFVSQIEKDGIVKNIESELIKKDGSSFWIIESARLIKDENGKAKYFEGSCWDVTNRREVTAALDKASLQVELTNRAKIDFLTNMGHELRTPLNAIIGFSEIIKDEVVGPIGEDSYKEYAQDIYDGGNYLLKIISEILEVSKIETGERELSEGEVKITSVVKSCMTILDNKIKEAKIKIFTEVPDDLPLIWGDKLVFKQILFNLIGNSIKFTPQTGKITISAKKSSDNSVVIEVKDTGIGMSEEELEKALLPFGQVSSDHNRENSGTGLGLTIVDSLIKMHDGKFRLDSQKGYGTTARITIPSSRIIGLEEDDLEIEG